jgi:hypothetical protein
VKHPGDPPDGFPALAGANSGRAIGDMAARPRDYDALMKFVNETEREERLRMPCYVCGAPSGCLCSRCHRLLCPDCWEADHGPPSARRCDFIIAGRSPD